MTRVSFKAILLGVAVNLGGALLLLFSFILVYYGILHTGGMPHTQLLPHTVADQSFLTAVIIIRLLSIGAGAFAAARFAGIAEYTHAMLVWLLGFLIGFLFKLVPHSGPEPSWNLQHLDALYVAQLSIALTGALVAKRTNKRRLSRGAA